MNVEATASLDPGKVYVVYCDGIGFNASTKGAYKLAQLGFRVKELLGGLDWWHREDRGGIDDLLPQINMPCCLYAGDADDIYLEARAARERIPGAVFISLPGLDHCQAFIVRLSAGLT